MATGANGLSIVTSLATVMNGTDLVQNVLRELAGESLSGEIDGVDLLDDFGHELIASRIASELSIYMG